MSNMANPTPLGDNYISYEYKFLPLKDLCDFLLIIGNLQDYKLLHFLVLSKFLKNKVLCLFLCGNFERRVRRNGKGCVNRGGEGGGEIPI